MGDRRIEAIDNENSTNSRAKGWAMLQQMRDGHSQQNQSLKAGVSDQQSDFQRDNQDYDFEAGEAGSTSGTHNAASTINANKGSSSDTDGGQGGQRHRKDDDIKLANNHMKKGKVKNQVISMFDD